LDYEFDERIEFHEACLNKLRAQLNSRSGRLEELLNDGFDGFD